jgi:subtilisin family serine protease
LKSLREKTLKWVGLFFCLGLLAACSEQTEAPSGEEQLLDVNTQRADTCLFPNSSGGRGTPSAILPPEDSDIAEPKFENNWVSRSYNYFWGFESLFGGGPSYWDSELSSSINEVMVAVIDTGVDASHPDFAAGQVLTADGYNWVDGNTDTSDDNGHGTHVAGTIAAQADSAGIVGVAPFVKILPLKVLDSNGSGYVSDVIDAIQYAVEKGADVINLSLGGHGTDSTFYAVSQQYNEAISKAVNGYWGKKSLVIAAAGNGVNLGGGTSSYYLTNSTPANAREVIAVGAHTPGGDQCSFSDFGWKLAVGAPGCGTSSEQAILSLTSADCTGACPNDVSDGYDIGALNGTSMAAPHVSGVAALALAENYDLTQAKFAQILRMSANAATGEGDLTNKVNYNLGVGLLSAQGIGAHSVDPDVFGVRITGPEEGVKVEDVKHVCFRIEDSVDGNNYDWEVYAVSTPDPTNDSNPQSIDLSTLASGDRVASGSGSGNLQTKVDLSLTPDGNERALILKLEDTTEGNIFYDVMELIP